MMQRYLVCILLLYQITGFALASEKVKPLISPKNNRNSIQPVTWNCVRELVAIQRWKYFQSRGYPKRLIVKESRCSWKITTNKGSRIRLAFRGIELKAEDPEHCSTNYIEIIDEKLKATQARFCGKVVPGDIISKGNKIRIDFQAASGVYKRNKGFSIGYIRTEDEPGFYQVQSLLSKKRISSKTPSSTVLSNIDKKLKTNEKSNKDDSASLGTIVGASVGCFVGFAFIAILIWRKQKKKKNTSQTKERNSSPLDASAALPKMAGNIKIDPFQCTPAVNNHHSVPNKDRFTYINCISPPLPKHKYLPEALNHHSSNNYEKKLTAISKWRQNSSINLPVPSQEGTQHFAHSNHHSQFYKNQNHGIGDSIFNYQKRTSLPNGQVIEERKIERAEIPNHPDFKVDSRFSSRRRMNHQSADHHSDSRTQALSSIPSSSLHLSRRRRRKHFNEWDKQTSSHSKFPEQMMKRMSSSHRRKFDHSMHTRDRSQRNLKRDAQSKSRSISDVNERLHFKSGVDQENVFSVQTSPNCISRNNLRSSNKSKFHNFNTENKHGRLPHHRRSLGHRSVSRAARYLEPKRDNRRLNHFSSERINSTTNRHSAANHFQPLQPGSGS